MGRKKLYGEETVPVTVKVPKSKKEYYKNKFRKILINEDLESNEIYEDILKKFIPIFLEKEIDIDFTDEEFKVVKKIHEEITNA